MSRTCSILRQVRKYLHSLFLDSPDHLMLLYYLPLNQLSLKIYSRAFSFAPQVLWNSILSYPRSPHSTQRHNNFHIFLQQYNFSIKIWNISLQQIISLMAATFEATHN